MKTAPFSSFKHPSSALPVLALLALAWGFMVFGHDYIGRTLANSWDINARQAFNARFTVIGGVMGAVFLVVCLIATLRSGRFIIQKLAYFGLTAVLALLAFKYLLVVNSEIMHFPQYALVAVLVYVLLGNFPETLFFTIFLGILDEAYQFFVLAPEKTSYVDFNDMWLNAIGGAIGLLIAGSLLPRRLAPKSRYLSPRSPVVITIIMTTLAVALLFFTGILGYQYTPGGPDKYYLMRQTLDTFWTKADFQVTYHIVRPLEGLIGLCLIWAAYLPMERLFVVENAVSDT